VGLDIEAGVELDAGAAVADALGPDVWVGGAAAGCAVVVAHPAVSRTPAKAGKARRTDPPGAVADWCGQCGSAPGRYRQGFAGL
jgi:hypothetical protein